MNHSTSRSEQQPAAERPSRQIAIPADPGLPLPESGPTSPADHLISIHEIRAMFGLGRTAAYELTRRPGFPSPVRISARCYRWWAAEVTAFATALRDQ
jgi:predicted DNA-binding transcriptional regulator AlpA